MVILDASAGDEPDAEASTTPEQTETELDASLTAAYDEKSMPMPADWTDEGHQTLLDVVLQYTLTAAIWDGVYVTMEAEPDIAPLGDEDHTDVDPAELFRRLGWVACCNAYCIMSKHMQLKYMDHQMHAIKCLCRQLVKHVSAALVSTGHGLQASQYESFMLLNQTCVAVSNVGHVPATHDILCETF